jgi:hypothetical protein
MINLYIFKSIKSKQTFIGHSKGSPQFFKENRQVFFFFIANSGQCLQIFLSEQEKLFVSSSYKYLLKEKAFSNDLCYDRKL